MISGAIPFLLMQPIRERAETAQKAIRQSFRYAAWTVRCAWRRSRDSEVIISVHTSPDGAVLPLAVHLCCSFSNPAHGRGSVAGRCALPPDTPRPGRQVRRWRGSRGTANAAARNLVTAGCVRSRGKACAVLYHHLYLGTPIPEPSAGAASGGLVAGIPSGHGLAQLGLTGAGSGKRLS